MKIERYITIGFIVLGLLLFWGAVLTYQNGQRIIRAGEALTQSSQVLYQIEALKREITDIESYTRAYVITSDPKFSSITTTTLDSAYKRIDVLRSLLSGNRVQLARLDSLVALGQSSTQGNFYIRNLVKEGKTKKAVEFIETGAVVNLTKQLRSIADKIKADEVAELSRKQNSFQRGQDFFLLAYVLRSIFIPIILLVVYFIIRHYLRSFNKTEAQLKETADFLHSLIEYAPVTIIVRDIEGRIVMANEEMMKPFNLNAEQVKGKTFFDLLPPEDAERFYQQDKELIRGNKILKEENEVTVNGAKQTLFTIRFPLYDDKGNIKSIAGIGLNITDLKNQKEALRIINEELQLKIKELFDYKYALDESSVVAITDKDGIIKYANDNFCKISKYSREELVGQDHRIINSGYHSKEFWSDLWETISSGKIWRGEIMNRAKSGTPHWMATIIVPFLDAVGKPYQYLALRADITNRKQAEELLMQRSSQLHAANKELESFSYSVSHDLRAPLRAIHGYTQILKEDYSQQLSREAEQVMDVIMLNAKKMGQLIDDLLAFSRLGRQELQKNDISMNDTVADVCEELKDSAQQKRIEYDIKDLHPARADRVIIKQVWINLISNALKYSSLKEKITVEIGSQDEGNEIIYYVKDNGAGFDMRYYDKLFGVFQRLHTEEQFDGTGVGLAIVQRIVTKHGGRVWAEGKVNEGATFYFTLSKS